MHRGLPARLAAAPISWGVCEVPGWGLQLPPERVLAEMAELGITATELGPQGWLPLDGAAGPRRARPLRAAARRRVRAGRRARARPRRDARRRGPRGRASSPRPAPTSSSPRSSQDARLVGAAGRSTTTAGSARASTCARSPTSSRAEGLELVLHPHVGTLVETAARRRAGARAHRRAVVLRHRPPADRRRRPGRVRPRARRSHRPRPPQGRRRAPRGGRPRRRALTRAGHAGRPVPAAGRRRRADRRGRRAFSTQSGYERWLVLEQDLAITGSEPPAGGGPALDVRKSIEFLSTRAPRREVSHR